MPSKKKIQFSNIIKELGFPTDTERMRDTYKLECFDSNSEMYMKSIEFENKINEEMQMQDSTSQEEYDNNDADYYSNFEKIFLEYAEIFNPEVYLLQMSVLLERDLLTREKIRAALKRSRLENLPEKFLEDLQDKDEDAIANLIQLLSDRKVKQQDIVMISEFIRNLPTSNVWLPSSNKRSLQSIINTIRNRLSNSDVVLVEESDSNINVINSQVHIGNEKFLQRRENENQARYEQANEEIDLTEELKKIAPCDLKYIFRYPNLGAILAEKLYYSDEEAKSVKNRTIMEDPIHNKLYAQEDITSIVNSNLKYIDFDKLLLTILQVEFDKYEDNVSKFSYEEAKRLKELSEKIEKQLSKKDIEIASDRFYGGISFNEVKSAIQALNDSYIDGSFYSQEELSYEAEDYINGQKDARNLTPYEFRHILKFTDENILDMLNHNPSLLEYLIKNDIMVEEHEDRKDDNINDRLFELLERQRKIPVEQLQILYNAGKLTSQYLLELYMDKDKIDLESIQALKSVDEKLTEGMADTEKLVELYLSDDEKEKFDKYRKLYRKLLIEGKTLEERNELSDTILDKSMDLLEEERIMELYSLGIVTLDTVIGYTGGSHIKELYLSNELKPIDARRLFYEGNITEDMLRAIMLDSSIDEGRKITLLYSTFPDVEDTDIMQRLEGCLAEVNEDNRFNSASSDKKIGSTRKKQDEVEDEFKKLKKAYEPRAKYRLLSIIDEEYELKYNEKDGTAIFYFPSKDEYLIEKLYDKERKPATNVATYILSKSVYEANENKILQDGRINISELYSLKKSNVSGVKRLVHTGWANAIIKYYGLDDERKYSNEKIAEIKALAKQVEESKKEIER